MTTRIYLTNLAAYNRGILKGHWVELPQEEGDLEKIIAEVLGNDEEYFITDHESPFEIHEYENIHELNRFIEGYDALDEYGQDKAEYLLNTIGLKREEILDNLDDVEYYPELTLEDLAEEFVDDGIFGDIPESIKPYIDYEKIGRDLSFDGYHETSKGVFFFR